MRFPPANIQLRRAQLVLMLAVLVPTILMTLIGIVLLIFGGSTSVVAGVLVITMCASAITGYILVSIFVGKGASLALVQNDFVSSVSHELRTPLTSIRLLIESLRDGRLADDDRAQVLSLLGREADRLETLVGRVLEISRIQSDNHVWNKGAVAIDDLVEESIAAFDASTLTNPTKITREVEPGLSITGDKPMLVRALVNLLVNSWKYTKDDKQITVSARATGRWVELVVRDNGIGIDGAEQKAIFEQFQRGRAAVQSGAAGVGLGLAFVNAIVRGHKGKLDLQSGGGVTELRIRLKRRLELPKRHTTGAEAVAS